MSCSSAPRLVVEALFSHVAWSQSLQLLSLRASGSSDDASTTEPNIAGELMAGGRDE